jgi:RNA-directed DNA polymerase
VDDFVLLDDSPQWLNYARADIEAFLPELLGLRLNPRKTVIQPLERGVDFVGQVIKPWRRTVRKRTRNDALARLARIPEAEFFESANSYFGLFGQAPESHHDRALLANLARRRGFTVNGALTQAYRI